MRSGELAVLFVPLPSVRGHMEKEVVAWKDGRLEDM